VKQYRFFAHFNRVNMQRGNPLVWTVHFRNLCIQARELVFRVSVSTRFRPEGRQPRAVLIGDARAVDIREGVAYIS
jgi:hypothetical protein